MTESHYERLWRDEQEAGKAVRAERDALRAKLAALRTKVATLVAVVRPVLELPIAPTLDKRDLELLYTCHVAVESARDW